MPTIPQGELPRPRAWDEFEDIVLDLYKRVWADPNADRHGRTGQRQHGVDVYGQPLGLGGRYVGIQCKRYAEGTLTREHIEAEIAKAEKFWAPLVEFIIITTESRDARLQQIVGEIDDRRQAVRKFRVRIVFWETLCSLFSEPANSDLLEKHYGDWLARFGGGKQGLLSREELERFTRDCADPHPGPVRRHNHNVDLSDDELRRRIMVRNRERKPTYLLRIEYARRLDNRGL